MLYYIHGYASGPNSAKGILFKEKLGAIPVKYMDSDEVDVNRCVENIKNAIKNDTRVILIGSSFGGFLSAKIALENRNVRSIVLLNPAVVPPDATVSDPSIPDKVVRDIQNSGLFEKKIPCDVYIVMSTRDELIPQEWVLKFAMFQEAIVKFIEDDHRISRNISLLPDIISTFLKYRE
ncbi:MAG: alpha/beta fold hydrolase [Thermoplasmata archaeon]|nr:alpha/beta fold hydrolase [Thermoplasmata archaeon]